MARLNIGVVGSRKSAFASRRPSGVPMRCEKRFGSKVG
jgi:hypothetical protein